METVKGIFIHYFPKALNAPSQSFPKPLEVSRTEGHKAKTTLIKTSGERNRYDLIFSLFSNQPTTAVTTTALNSFFFPLISDRFLLPLDTLANTVATCATKGSPKPTKTGLTTILSTYNLCLSPTGIHACAKRGV